MASNEHVAVDNANRSSFESSGPAEFSKTTTIRLAPDKVDEIGATSADYEMMEASIIDYMDAGGRVIIKDSEAARAKLDREKVLRIENSDPAAIRLLSTELQADVLIQVKAVPTSQSNQAAPGQKAVRLIAKATGTTDARNLGTAFVDMPLPMTKTNVNIYTRYLSEKLMQGMTQRWANNPVWDPIEVRIYKAASIDDSLKIRKMIQGLKGVTEVTSRGATGSSATSYATLAVAFAGAPEDMYGELKDSLGKSQGLKAVDLQNNTIDLEVTGPMELTTTTTTSQTKTTTETKTDTTVTHDPINPAPGQ
jgi:hypothetical protein